MGHHRRLGRQLDPGTLQVTSASPIGTLAHTYTDDTTL